MCALDPSTGSVSMAPNLSADEKLSYLSQQRNFIEEVLEDAKDCKWVYQALIECSTIRSRLKGRMALEERDEMLGWVEELMRLDPLRKGRWLDLQTSLTEDMQSAKP